jgi:hypothetical protein
LNAADARRNIEIMSVTFETFHAEMLPLKVSHVGDFRDVPDLDCTVLLNRFNFIVVVKIYSILYVVLRIRRDQKEEEE